MRSLALILLLFAVSQSNAQWSELGGFNSLMERNDVNSICSDKAGNVYASGSFTSPPLNGPYISKWNGQSWSKLEGVNATFIGSICTNENGLLFAMTYTPTQYGVSNWDGNSWTNLGGPLAGQNLTIEKLSADSNNLYVTGKYTNGIPYVARWNSGSNWAILGSFNGHSAYKHITSICTDKAGNIYATGGFTNSTGNYYVAIWDGSNWAEVGGLNGLAPNNIIYTIHSDINGNLLAAGTFTNSNGNLFVAKWDGIKWTELFEFAQTTKDEFISEMYSDPAGNLYVGGFLWSKIFVETFVGKWNGSTLQELSGGQGSHFAFMSMASDPTGNLYAAGKKKNGYENNFVAIYPKAKFVGISDQQSNSDNFTIFPNPSSDKITIQVKENNPCTEFIAVRISDILGKVLYEKNSLSQESIHDISGLSPGFYLVSVNLNGRSYTRKILKD